MPSAGLYDCVLKRPLILCDMMALQEDFEPVWQVPVYMIALKEAFELV